MRRTLQVFAVASVLGGASSAWADFGFPDSVKFPKQIREAEGQSIQKEDVAETEVIVDKSGTKVTKHGTHYQRWLSWVPASGEPALGYYNGSEARIAKAITELLTKDGWASVFTSEDHGQLSFHATKGTKDAWLVVQMDAPQAQVRFDLVEVGDQAVQFALQPPGKTPEKFTDQDDVPYLPLFPGSTRRGEGRDSGPLDVTPPGSGNVEPQLVGTGAVTRNYEGPKTLSALQFVRDVTLALQKVGWIVLFPKGDKLDPANGTVIAHYAKNGRDVWVRLTYEFGAVLWYSIADVGGEDWSAKLEKECHLPLYGVLFDFNKATLKPESESVLAKAAAVLKAAGTVTVEVQGHTDNKGGEAYNTKLSDARAASVKKWLEGHGIAAQRLTSKGYGESQPVAPNDTAEGRAKNRRVELRKPGCTN